MSSNLTGATIVHNCWSRSPNGRDNRLKICIVLVRFPSCSQWKVSITGNAAVLKTAVRASVCRFESCTFRKMESRQILVCCGFLLRSFLCKRDEGSIPLLSAFTRCSSSEGGYYWGVGNDGGVTADCKSATLDTQGVQISHAPQKC